ncbi:hypothetical protein [Aeromonas rivipollensis]|uniref:hypothetical protein n=1 Tax=Aeromonas rivipollensis TaxID=948519 RepID=UPI003D1DA546
MRLLFKIWFFATVASLIIYVPTYFISNDEIDAVQEITAEDLMPITGMRGRDNERFAAFLQSAGVDTSTTFVDALEENDLFSNVEVDREFNFEVQFPIKNQAAFRSSSKTTVIPPFFGALKSRGHAACAKRCFGV